MTTLTPEQQQDLAQRFQGLATQWDAATRYRSNTHALRDHPVYQELVALGEPAVPLILMELERGASVFWFLVLVTITGEDPVPPALAGRMEAMALAWIDWGRQRGYVFPTDGGRASSVRMKTSSTARLTPWSATFMGTSR